ncbi:TIGR03087 family PEP-CTERM/XrtA system glycosyltransferase [Psychrobium sp. 1_MG-2023]|uniref:TIGR03087 family PEP-CTERM/XrtA system glycosyltransferase n=1 Tax=Psychrobium sp. 1_MG-2023 TaxID=3062624 RepID=UPI000C3372E2|nr:TIGR03087 family PEP-CTERM/XrtA system glycosyltransferase [Psychrobium sp. 1_MG-2023]MDP2561130.1 TIGR03087 family PEP-CTERM/XrtA system glycosyltransferase [Psychrobium sp. 1_MG-2023]PKF55106.1 glycosyl transferase family 1 [Alteromonadales bacterium alter-6D02]
MNILYLCHRFPYPAKDGSRVRSFNIINHFQQQGHKVWVASMVRNSLEEQEGQGIAPFCHQYIMARVNEPVQQVRMVSRLLSFEPSSMGFFYSKSLAIQIKKLLNEQKFDLIYVHCSSVAQYVEQVTDTAKILDFVDMDSQKWLSFTRFKPFPVNMGYWLEGRKLERAEKRLSRSFDMCTTITRTECDTLDSFELAQQTDWFSNGVDVDYFKPITTSYSPHIISFIGRMDYYPNEQAVSFFCHEILPLIRQQITDVEFLIVGAAPSDNVRALAAIEGVTVTGFVDDVRDYVQKSAVMVAPLKIARGTQNKILEAMAMGVPVVTSSLGARGVDGEAGEDFFVAQTPEQYSEQILSLMKDKMQRSIVAQAGRQRILSNYSWPYVLKRLDDIVATTINHFKNASV